MKYSSLALFFVASFCLTSCFQDTKSIQSKGFDKEVNVYTDRHYQVDDSIFSVFEREFGVRINIVKGDAQELLARIEKEGQASKADLLITTDIARLYQAKLYGFFQPIALGDALLGIPEYLFDDEGYWFGLTKRARVIVVSKKEEVDAQTMNYENLANPNWSGRVSMRSKENVYNQSLLASMIAANGEEEALDWIKGVVANMYQSPKGNDRDQVKSIYAGKADITLINTYYLGKMFTSDDPLEVEAAKSVNIIFPNQNNRGTHINISGVGVLQHAPNKLEAMELIKFLLSERIQGVYAEVNFEYPVHSNVKPCAIVESWGDFKEDRSSLNQLGALNTTAIKLFDKGGWK